MPHNPLLAMRRYRASSATWAGLARALGWPWRTLCYRGEWHANGTL